MSELAGSNAKKQEFFANGSLALELADELPALQESVHVVGFPTGGTTICITEGVVSRIDLVSASAFNNLLAIQIDAAINRERPTPTGHIKNVVIKFVLPVILSTRFCRT